MSTVKKKNSPARPPGANVAEAAFNETAGELEKLARDEILTVNADIPTCVTIALGAEPLLHALVPQIQKELPQHPIHYAKHLRRYALASWYTHLLSVPAERGENAVKKLLAEAAPLRETLLVAAEALAHKGLFDSAHVASIRSGQGNVDTANDLVALSVLFDTEWERVSNKTAVDDTEVRRAGILGTELLVALGEREVAGLKKTPSNAQELRARAFTLFVRAYDECRRAVAYLRWKEDDADAIAPSLFKRRGSASRGATEVVPPVGGAPNGSAAPSNP